MSAPFAPIDLTRVALVLDDLGGKIEDLGAGLCTDPALVSGHIDRLQEIDRIAQYLRALGALLRAECMTAAVEQVGLDELVVRLTSD